MKPTIFIGSGEASRLERKTLIHSIRKNASCEVDIYVFNGTHDALELNDGPPQRIGMSLEAKYMNVTEFSNYRFLIPQIMEHKGMAAFVDSDTICFGDVKELFDTPMEGNQFLCKGDAYAKDDEPRWGLSVTLFDCETARFDLDTYVKEIGQGLYTYTDLHQMSPKFLALHPFKIGQLNPKWNDFDNYDSETRLIHYTNLMTQPWKYPGHKFGDIWFKHFNEAREAGYVTEHDIDLSISRSYCRPNIREGNSPASARPKSQPVGVKTAVRQLAGAVKRKLLAK